jgi:nitroimidazol reductase NimA-like FMN-containing flavoprotein (pyridoxamine 5'-phosphate oxidase superfamily)
MDNFTPTERTTVRRLAKRGSYDRELVYSILDEALFCHVGFIADGAPVVIPTIHVRIDDRLYIHGSAASHMLRSLREESRPVSR